MKSTLIRISMYVVAAFALGVALYVAAPAAKASDMESGNSVMSSSFASDSANAKSFTYDASVTKTVSISSTAMSNNSVRDSRDNSCSFDRSNDCDCGCNSCQSNNCDRCDRCGSSGRIRGISFDRDNCGCGRHFKIGNFNRFRGNDCGCRDNFRHIKIHNLGHRCDMCGR